MNVHSTVTWLYPLAWSECNPHAHLRKGEWVAVSGTKTASEMTPSDAHCSDTLESACLPPLLFMDHLLWVYEASEKRWRTRAEERETNEVGGGGWFAITHPDKVIREQPPASTQLALPPSSIIPPYVHDDVAHRQAQLIILLSLIVELHHGLHCEGETHKELGNTQKVLTTRKGQTLQRFHRVLYLFSGTVWLGISDDCAVLFIDSNGKWKKYTHTQRHPYTHTSNKNLLLKKMADSTTQKQNKRPEKLPVLAHTANTA